MEENTPGFRCKREPYCWFTPLSITLGSVWCMCEWALWSNTTCRTSISPCITPALSPPFPTTDIGLWFSGSCTVTDSDSAWLPPHRCHPTPILKLERCSFPQCCPASVHPPPNPPPASACPVSTQGLPTVASGVEGTTFKCPISCHCGRL